MNAFALNKAERRSRIWIAMLAVLALALITLAGAPAARAELPWWHLTSGSRPAYLHTGVTQGVDDVQELVKVVPEGGGLFYIASPTLTSEEIENEVFTEGPTKGTQIKETSTAKEVEEGLEGLAGYGPGSVHVQLLSVNHYEVTFVGPLAQRPVALMREGYSGVGEIKQLTAGSSPTDGELYLTAENVGDANVGGAKTAVKLKDVLPAGLHALGVSGSKPIIGGEILNREPLPCSLEEKAGVQSATCTLEGNLAPYQQLQMRVAVDLKPGASSGELNRLGISGGEGFTCNGVAGGIGKFLEGSCSKEVGEEEIEAINKEKEKVKVKVKQQGGFELTGTGPAASASIARPITISEAPVPFGVEEYEMALEEEGGSASSQAGAHPFQLNTTIALNQLRDLSPLTEKAEVSPAALAKDLNFKLPVGLIGNATAIPRCSTAQFFASVEGKENRCPADTAVGVAVATVREPANAKGTVTLTEPLFNLEPRIGEPARFGFYVEQANSPVFIDTSVRTGSDYGITASVQNITQTAAFLSSEVTFWGVPGDPRHDRQRGWGCIYEALDLTPHPPCNAAEEQHPPPFLSLPTSCAAAMGTEVEGDSWSSPGSFVSFTGLFDPSAPLSGCNRLQFSPEIRVAPDGQEASKPTGLTVDVHVPQEVNENAQGLASSNVKSITVAFPEGVKLNPSAADGLLACSEQQIGLLGGRGAQEELLFTPTLPQAFCPNASKIGTVKIKTPLLPAGQPVEGALYLATPAPNGEGANNPFNSLLAMYIVAEDPISGSLVKLPGKASLDSNSGQLTATFENNPQLAFEDAEIHLFGGERAPLATPSHCGTYTTRASFTPWSGTGAVSSSSSFQITSGPNASACPGATLPFSPTLTGGTTNINAGSFSPLTTTISREDGNQDVQAVSLHMPPGLSGILTGVTLCPEANANAGSCPQNSLIGHTIVSVGLGGDPFSVTGGQVFLTEGYEGAPFGLSIVNPAVAGPFDLGKVIVRAKVEVDPHTAALTVTTNESGAYSIPHILDGIPLQIKHVNVLIDRPGFIFNPTNCNPQSITGTITSDEKAPGPVSTPFQATNCASLKFAPKFTVATSGKTSKASGASLSVKLTYPNAPAGTYANVAKVKVSLPKQLPSRLTTLQKACTAAAFEANPASCPKESIVGQAKVLTPLLPVALNGPAYFVSHGGEAFPDLTIVLKGYGVTVDLVGSTQIKSGITTTTFKTTPDVPFSSFELNLPQGKYSALAANANLCKSSLTMPTEFQAQNGLEIHQSTKISVTGCPKPLSKKQQLAKALKACQKKRNHTKRTACDAQARKRFSAKKSQKKR